MSDLHVICKIAGSEYALPADEIYQMENYAGATPVPGAPFYVAGLVQIRQQIIPVLDMRSRFGLPKIDPTLESRVVVLQVREKLVGLVVDSAREVRVIPHGEFKAPPEVISTQSSGFVKSVASLKNRIVMLLDSEKVIGEGVISV